MTMNDIDLFKEPEIELEIPKQLEENHYTVTSCLKIDDGYSAYTMTSEHGRKVLLKKATDPVISISLANEKKLLDIIHQQENKRLADTFPQAGFFSSEGDTAWYMRDFISGSTLSELCEQNIKAPGLSRQRALDYVIQVAELLDFLHGLEPPIIHRDIKPQNVVVDSEGVCHLIDLGISRIWSGGKGEDTVVMGTKSTMPPEQFGYRQTDGRSDIYSVGVLLYYCLTGDYNVEGDLSELDGDLREIIEKATKFDPSQRYQTAREMLSELLQARYGALLTPPEEKKPRLKKLFALGVALTAVLSAAVMFFAYPYVAGLFSKRPVPIYETVYDFSDPFIEQIVRDKLGIPEDEPIFMSDLAKITEIAVFGKKPYETYKDFLFYDQGRLDISDYEIKMSGITAQQGDIDSLEDLTYMPNLHTLCLYNQKLSDISAIKHLGITSLEIGYCPITDFSPIGECASISSLTLTCMDTLDDISFIEDLQNLNSLNIAFTNVSDISPIAGKNISNMSVRGCKRITDFSPLTQTRYGVALLSLSYSEAALEQIKGVNTTMMTLSYDDDSAEEISFEGLESGFEDLQHLCVYGSLATELEVRFPEKMNLPKLEKIEFNGTACIVINDFSPLECLEALNTLEFMWIKRSSCLGLDKIPNLQIVRCSSEQKGIISVMYPDNGWTVE